jgi:glycosyltransferase involved in cell wall biosynthesis
LRPCDELLIIDDSSDDGTDKVAHQYGATLKTSIAGVTPGAYVMDAAHDWILCLCPNEALSEDLEATLFEWKEKDPGEHTACFAVSMREENESGWQPRESEVRLVNRKLVNWVGELPPIQPCKAKLLGDLLRFHQP